MVYKKREGLFEKVYKIVKKIPKGKVATYGQIARIIGTRDPRKVGWALAGNKDSKVPCHRVVSKEGQVAKNFGKLLPGDDGWEVQKELLETEGVEFKNKMHVDLDRHLWKG